MKREEAVRLIKEIDEECRDIRGSSILLMAPDESNIHSRGYQVHIKIKADWSRLRCLQTITEQYGYIVKNEPDQSLVVIYTPPQQPQKTQDTTKPPIPTGFA